MDMSKIVGGVLKEGYLEKQPQSKGIDRFRNKSWKKRYFVLKQKSLYYYKEKGDRSHKGRVDLHDSMVEVVEDVTKTEFTFKILQSKQHFLYIRASSSEEMKAWVDTLMENGMPLKTKDGIITKKVTVDPNEEKEEIYDVPEAQLAARMSFGVMFKDENDLYYQQFTLLLDLEKAEMHILKEGLIHKSLRIRNMDNIAHSTKAESRLPSGKKLVPVRFQILKGQKALKDYEFNLGTPQDAKSLEDLLHKVIDDNVGSIYMQLSFSPIHWGFCEVRAGDATSRWIKNQWVIVDTKRMLIFQDYEATFPLWVISLEGAKVFREGKFSIEIKCPLLDYALRFRKASETQQWFDSLEKGALEYIDRVPNMEKFKESNDTEKNISLHLNTLEKYGVKPLVSGPTFIACWGNGEQGQLGTRTKDSIILPTQLDYLVRKNVNFISASKWGNFSVALTSEGNCYIWGKGRKGELGIGEARLQNSSPYAVTSLRNSKIVRVSCGATHCLALSSEGEAFSWGAGSFGQLGHGLPDDYYYPKKIDAFEGILCTEVAAGGYHSAFVLESTKQLFLCGRNAHGQLGLGAVVQNEFLPVKSPLCAVGPVICVSLGYDFSAAVVQSGQLFTWGNGQRGKLGVNDVQDRLEPTHVSWFDVKNLKVVRVDCGEQHMLALANNRRVYSWGAYELNGLGKNRDRIVPSRIKPITDVTFIQAGASHSFFINTEGHLFAYGLNSNAELGVGRISNQPEMVQTILSEDLKVSSAVAGCNFSLAIIEGVGDVIKITDSSILKNEFNSGAIGVRSSNHEKREDSLDALYEKEIIGKFLDKNDPARKKLTEMNSTDSDYPPPPGLEVGVISQAVTADDENITLVASSDNFEVAVNEVLAILETELPAEPKSEITEAQLPLQETEFPEIIDVESVELVNFLSNDESPKASPVIENIMTHPHFPDGWKRAVDAKSGKVYFYNKSRQETKWESDFMKYMDALNEDASKKISKKILLSKEGWWITIG